MWQSCPVCDGGALEPFFGLERAPVFCNVQHATREEALAAPTAPITLGICPRCELIANVDFDAAQMEYAEGYENSLHVSGHFQHYAESIARSLIERYRIRNTDVIDIGCGQGEFLKLICRLGRNRGFGFDPSYEPQHAGHIDGGSERADNVSIIAEPYGESLMSRPASLVCCRHVLEHIPSPLAFLRSIRKTVGSRHDTIIFFEVPNALWTFKELGIWDILYEHCTYFTPTALANAFTQAGFKPLRVETTYGDQFLTIECSPASPLMTTQAAGTDVKKAVQQFRAAYDKVVSEWQQRLRELRAASERIVLWGAGSKGVMFLHTLALSHEELGWVVDSNPRKQGRFVAGTGQEIVAPGGLRDIHPDVVVVLNPLYVDEIKGTLANLNLAPRVISV